MVGGIGGSTSTTSDSHLASVEIFPPPSSSGCSIPDLPGTRYHHSISLLSGGRLVVCGGTTSNCISWVAGNTTWTIFGTMRFQNKRKLCFNLFLLLHSYTRYYHVAWVPPTLPDSVVLFGTSTHPAYYTAEIVPGRSRTKLAEMKKRKCFAPRRG